MHDGLWCPEGHTARDPTRTGPSSALCACGAQFSSRLGVQAAYRAKAGVEGALPVAAQPIQPEPTAPPAPESGPSADDPVPPTLEMHGWSEAEINAPPQFPEGNDPEADPEPKPEAEAVGDPRPPRRRDILDWLARGPDA